MDRRTIDTLDWMGDWMDKVFEMECDEMFATEEEAAQREPFDLLALE